jgi:hypothetical protein
MIRKALGAIALAVVCSVPAVAHDGDDHEHTDSKVTIEIRDNYRYIRANGLPNHETGRFPNRGNPNSISEQSYSFRVPLNPTPLDRPREVRGALFGVAINGVVFDPGTNEYWNNNRNWRYEAMSGKIPLGIDANHAHVQPSGAYHYHGLPTGLIKALDADKKQALIGYAADGYPIYTPWAPADPKNRDSKIIELKSSYRVKKGNRPTGDDSPGGRYDGTFVADHEFVRDSGDLDECNGRFGPTPEYPDGTYHYVITSDFPFIPRMFKGAADESFELRRPGPQGPGQPRRPPPPHDRRPPRD